MPVVLSSSNRRRFKTAVLRAGLRQDLGQRPSCTAAIHAIAVHGKAIVGRPGKVLALLQSTVLHSALTVLHVRHDVSTTHLPPVQGAFRRGWALQRLFPTCQGSNMDQKGVKYKPPMQGLVEFCAVRPGECVPQNATPLAVDSLIDRDMRGGVCTGFVGARCGMASATPTKSSGVAIAASLALVVCMGTGSAGQGNRPRRGE